MAYRRGIWELGQQPNPRGVLSNTRHPSSEKFARGINLTTTIPSVDKLNATTTVTIEANERQRKTTVKLVYLAPGSGSTFTGRFNSERALRRPTHEVVLTRRYGCVTGGGHSGASGLDTRELMTTSHTSGFIHIIDLWV